MPVLDEDEDAVFEDLRRLDPKGQFAFAAACCERLFPCYKAFSLLEKWGNPSGLRRALDTIWSLVEEANILPEGIPELVSICSEAVPDSEDFQSILTGPAQYAAASIAHTLGYILDPNVDEIIQVARLAVDSVYEYVSAACDPHGQTPTVDRSLDDWVAKAPMLVAELNKQEQDIALIRSWEGTSSELIRRLQDGSRSVGIDPFGRGIVKEPES